DPRELLERAKRELGPLDAEVAPRVRVPFAVRDPAAEFAASSDVRLRIDETFEPLEPHGGATMRSAPDTGGFVVETRSSTDGFILPAFEFPPSGVAFIALDVESPVATALGVIDSRDADGDTSEAGLLREVQLPAGRHTLVFDIVHRGPPSRMIVHPGRVPGSFVVRSVEVRAGN
ncbi:MAG TPA: hypothetical protein VM509_11225, partial [Planctomycetota bacterium]|nr:hypothetical protein [Planctomycetota bacterium]